MNIRRFANSDSLDNVRSSFASWIGGYSIEELPEEQWEDPVTNALIDRIYNAPPIRTHTKRMSFLTHSSVHIICSPVSSTYTFEKLRLNLYWYVM